MYTSPELERYTTEQFAFLEKDHGFRPPQISRDPYTVFDYLREPIAVELQIDWREGWVFVLIVRLEGGQLPKGYYMSEGRKVRVHLLNTVRERKWGVDQKLLSRLRAEAKVRAESIEDFEAKVVDARMLVEACIDRILEENVALFQGSS